MSNHPNHPGHPGNWIRSNLSLTSDPDDQEQQDQQQQELLPQQQQLRQNQHQPYFGDLLSQQQLLAHQQQQQRAAAGSDRDSLLSLLASNSTAMGVGGLGASTLEAQQHLASFAAASGSASSDNSLVAALGGAAAPLNYFSTTPGGTALGGLYDPSSAAAFMAAGSAGLPQSGVTGIFPGFGGNPDPSNQQGLFLQPMWPGSSPATHPSLWAPHHFSSFIQPGYPANLDLPVPTSFLSPTAMGSFTSQHAKTPSSGAVSSAAPMNVPSSSKSDEGAGLAKGTGSREMDRKTRARRTKGKPKRPLSAYNIFFKEERTRILSEIPDKKLRAKKRRGDEDIEEEDEDEEEASNKGEDDADDDEDDEGDDGKPKKGSGKKRKRVPHGKIGFENLAKVVGQRWKDLAEERREHFKRLADLDMKRYRDEMEIFMKKQREGLELSRERLESLVDEETKKRYFEGSGKQS